jgi:type IV pilus assembly protein PilB
VARRIGELLVDAGVLSQSQLEQALFAQRKDGRKLGHLLIELGLVSEVHLTQALSRQLAVPWVSLYHVDFSRSLLNVVSRETAEKYCLVPIFVRRERKGETLFVAMDDPTNEVAIEEVSRASSLPVKPMIACPSDIRAAIRVYYLGDATTDAVSAGAPKAVPAIAPPPPGTPVRSDPPPPRSRPPKLKVAEAPPPSEPPPAEAKERETQPGDPDQGERHAKGGRKSKAPPGRTVSMTLLDGTRISIPAPVPRKRSAGGGEESPERGEAKDQLTARDLVSALRAVAHGVDASDILGTEPRWEAMFSALLSILLRKGLIADWEFVEEFRKL